MKENRIELADGVRRFKDRYVAEFGHRMMPSRKKALADIAACMTAEMGGHPYQCRTAAVVEWSIYRNGAVALTRSSVARLS